MSEAKHTAGLLDFASRIIIFQIEDDEEHVRLRFGGQDVITVKSSSAEGVALLKMEAERRAALAKAEPRSMSDLREALAKVEELIRRDPACFNLSDELQSVRAAIRAAIAQPQNDQDKNVEDAVTSTIFLSLADKDIVKATDCRLVAKRLLSEVIASPPSSRMRRALEHIERVTHKVVPLLGASEGLASAVNERLEAIRTVASEALRAGDNHDTPPSPERMREALDEDPLADQLLGRARFLRDWGETKSPELMEKAAQALRAGDNHASEPIIGGTALCGHGVMAAICEKCNHASDGEESGLDTFVEMNQKLRDRLASDGKESEGGPLNWQLSEDAKARIAEIDANRRNAAINANNIVTGKLPSDDLAAPLERIRTEAARMGYALVPNDREAIARSLIRAEINKYPGAFGMDRSEDFTVSRVEERVEAGWQLQLWRADAILALRGG